MRMRMAAGTKKNAEITTCTHIESPPAHCGFFLHEHTLSRSIDLSTCSLTCCISTFGNSRRVSQRALTWMGRLERTSLFGCGVHTERWLHECLWISGGWELVCVDRMHKTARVLRACSRPYALSSARLFASCLIVSRCVGACAQAYVCFQRVVASKALHMHVHCVSGPTSLLAGDELQRGHVCAYVQI